jgi:ubiquinone/menaquinone biosynthesis C-methylase UbiE
MEEGQCDPHTFDWNEYYNNAEGHNEVQFHTYLEPLMQKYSFDLSQAVDFACGKGRITDLLSGECQSLICVDTSKDAIRHCAERFKNKKNVECRVSEPEKIPVDCDSVSFLYSWDAMVHFDYRSVDYLLSEFSRILKVGGYAVLHHSNARDHGSFKADKNWRRNPHCRSEFNAEDMRHICSKVGFIVKEQQIVDWGVKELDCISVIKKL